MAEIEHNYFCMEMKRSDGQTCLHTQVVGDKCERCGSTDLYPMRLYGLKSAMDNALEAAAYSKDEHLNIAMGRVHEAFENVLYELKRIGDELETRKQS